MDLSVRKTLLKLRLTFVLCFKFKETLKDGSGNIHLFDRLRLNRNAPPCVAFRLAP